MMIEMKLIRRRSTPYGTDGELYMNNERVCHTTEHPKHRLPVGTYTVTLKKCKPYGRKVLVACNEEHCACMAYGNGLCGINDRRIYVGRYQTSGLVVNGYDTFKQLYNRINIGMRRGKSVKLRIIEL